MALYRIWLPPSARRKQKLIKKLEAEILAAEILIDTETGQTSQLRAGRLVNVPKNKVPLKVRQSCIDAPAADSGHQPRRPGQPALPATSS